MSENQVTNAVTGTSITGVVAVLAKQFIPEEYHMIADSVVALIFGVAFLLSKKKTTK